MFVPCNLLGFKSEDFPCRDSCSGSPSVSCLQNLSLSLLSADFFIIITGLFLQDQFFLAFIYQVCSGLGASPGPALSLWVAPVAVSEGSCVQAGANIDNLDNALTKMIPIQFIVSWREWFLSLEACVAHSALGHFLGPC